MCTLRFVSKFTLYIQYRKTVIFLLTLFEFRCLLIVSRNLKNLKRQIPKKRHTNKQSPKSDIQRLKKENKNHKIEAIGR